MQASVNSELCTISIAVPDKIRPIMIKILRYVVIIRLIAVYRIDYKVTSKDAAC